MSCDLKPAGKFRSRALDPPIPIGCFKDALANINEHHPSIARNRFEASVYGLASSTSVSLVMFIKAMCSNEEISRECHFQIIR
jgi:hypothetical protein